MRQVVSAIVTDKLTAYFEENPQVARTIIEKAITASRAAEAARKAREPPGANLAGGRGPARQAEGLQRAQNASAPRSSSSRAIAAGGSANDGRDRRFQAILSLWGKMLNVEKARLDKVYGNEKLLPMIAAVGCGIGDEFDIAKLRYDKIIIMADADVDGSHIRTLLLTFFFRYMRPLIELGHVYIASRRFIRSEGQAVPLRLHRRQMAVLLAEMPGTGKVNIQRYKGLGRDGPRAAVGNHHEPRPPCHAAGEHGGCHSGR